FYLAKTLLPRGLSPLYEFSPLLDPALFLGAGLATGALTLAAISRRRGFPAGLACWLAYLVILLPVVGLVKFGRHSAADRYAYLACLPWALLAGAALRSALDAAAPAARARLLAGAAVLLALLGGLSWRQSGFWRDPITLWSRVAETDPRSYFALG